MLDTPKSTPVVEISHPGSRHNSPFTGRVFFLRHPAAGLSEEAAMMFDEATPPTLLHILSGDTCFLIVSHIHTLSDLAATWSCMLPSLPRALREAVNLRAQALIEAAPLCLTDDFVQDAIWPVTVAACYWHPRPFFASLRAPAVCRVTGSGICSHGLCQKQESPKEGVLELLELMAAGQTPPCAPLALECLAWACGALGRKEAAMRAWRRAAFAGSPRAQLDLSVREYRQRTSTYSTEARPIAAKPLPPASPAERPAAQTAGTAEALLHAVVVNPALESLGVEGHTILARAFLHLGLMALDGDGTDQNDAAALEHLERALRAAKAGEAQVALDPSTRSHSRSRVVALDPSVLPCRGPIEHEHARRLCEQLCEVARDAQEILESMGRFSYFAVKRRVEVK